jgi:long-chain acyl-CoA synthetase
MDSAATVSPLCEFLERQVRDRARRVAIHCEAERRAITFSELGPRIAAWASALRRAGVQEEHTVSIAVGNVPAFAEIFFALRYLKAKVLAVDETSWMVSARMGASWIVQAGPEGPDLEGAPDRGIRLTPIPAEATVPAETALIKMTSGSTLAPRGACFTEAALLASVHHLLRGMDITSDDRVLISIPLSHSYGFDLGVLSMAVEGTPMILQSDILPSAILRSIREREVTFFPAVPALVRALGQVSWPPATSLRKVISASAPLSTEAAQGFARASGLHVSQLLGASECGGISFETRPGDPEAEGCVGFPLPGVRIELTEDGALRIHSKANRFALLPEQPVTSFVETGDRGSWTPEGRLRLAGRTTLVANIGGHKIDLNALDAFFRGLPGIDDAATVPVEDPARGHRIVAYVETTKYSEAKLLELCRERLSEREVPSEIHVVLQLPRTGRGKLDRVALSSQIQAQQGRGHDR